VDKIQEGLTEDTGEWRKLYVKLIQRGEMYMDDDEKL
jgi:hypothetical protein